MRFANNPEPKKYKGVAFIICQHFFLKTSQVCLNMQTHRVPEGSRKEKLGFPEGIPEAFFRFQHFQYQMGS